MLSRRLLKHTVASAILILPALAPSAKAQDSIPAAAPVPVPEITLSGIPVEPSLPLTQALDTIGPLRDSRWHQEHQWYNMLRRRQLKMSDPDVEWPPFLAFAVKVYNWGDHFFNGYDTEWVVGTGKRWKVRFVNDNWVDSYALNLPQDMDFRMMSELNANVGAYIQYMAVSVGYSFNLNHVMGSRADNRKRTQFGFNCARFDLNLDFTSNKSGTYLRTFKGYKKNRIFKSYFPGMEMTQFNADLLYFFNNHKFSYGAAYNYSRIQLKSAGSAIVGLAYTYLDLSFDFAKLSPDIRPLYKYDTDQVKFHYNDFCVVGGYSHNFVLNKHILLNLTLLPKAGFNNCYEDSSDGPGTLYSLGFKVRGAFTYNHRNLFAGITAKMDGDWYKSTVLSLFNSIETMSATVGYRF